MNWVQRQPQLYLFWFFLLLSMIAAMAGLIYPLGIGSIALAGTLMMLALRSKSELILFDLLPVLAILCLWVVPALSYVLQQANPAFWWVNTMPLPGSAYFSIAIPAVLAICLGSQVPRFWSIKADDSIVKQIQLDLSQQPWLPVLLMGVGLVAYSMMPYLGSGWRQLGHYMSQMIWVGGMHALLSPRYKLFHAFLVLVAFLVLIRDALYSTLFAEVAYWIAFGFLYAQLVWKLAFWKLMLIGFTGLLLLLFFLTFKYNYRGMAEASGGKATTRAALFFQALKNRLDDPLGDTWNLQQALQRFNEGYHK